VEQKSRRERPFQLLAARTIGYNIPGVMPVGLEGSFDKYLKGLNGIRLMQKISGNVWKPLNDENEVDPKEGNDVITTIDVNIQDVAENSLLTQLQMHKAESGCAVLMEVATGEIRAIANLRKGADGTYREDFNSCIGQSTGRVPLSNSLQCLPQSRMVMLTLMIQLIQKELFTGRQGHP
jgi:cell division protein FtsI (penicillin-binding protein 3)